MIFFYLRKSSAVRTHYRLSFRMLSGTQQQISDMPAAIRMKGNTSIRNIPSIRNSGTICPISELNIELIKAKANMELTPTQTSTSAINVEDTLSEGTNRCATKSLFAGCFLRDVHYDPKTITVEGKIVVIPFRPSSDSDVLLALDIMCRHVAAGHGIATMHKIKSEIIFAMPRVRSLYFRPLVAMFELVLSCKEEISIRVSVKDAEHMTHQCGGVLIFAVHAREIVTR